MKRRDKGFVLIVCLVFLAVLTLVVVFMFNGVILDERVAGNNREKSRAADASQLPLDLVKNWMGQSGNVYQTGDWVRGIDCSGAAVATTPIVCSMVAGQAVTNNPIIPFDTGGWNNYSTYAPSSVMNVNVNGVKNGFATGTQYYVEFMGTTSANPPTAIYKVTSAASGGNGDAVSVAQAVYNVQAKSRDIGGS